MMKRILTLVLAIVICLALPACGSSSGKIKNAEVDYGTSAVFTESEIKSATEVVLKKFKNYSGCDLKRLWYDEEKSNMQVDSYMEYGRGSVNGATRENVIVLLSDFYVDSSGGDGSLNPNFTYTDWNWILVREGPSAAWVLDDWGY